MSPPTGVEIVSLDEVEAAEEKAVETAVDDIDVEDEATTPTTIPSSRRKRKTTTTSAP